MRNPLPVSYMHLTPEGISSFPRPFGRVPARFRHGRAHPPFADLVDQRLEQANREDWSTLAGGDWNDAESLHAHLSRNTNIIKAAQLLRWHELLEPGMVALDLGCGSGWLSALLTREPDVERVIAWDASPTLLNDVLPQMATLMGGEPSKIERICGHFTPLLVATGSLDLVVMSSAFHHAADPDTLLAELVRVTRKDGLIVLLNEVPFSIPTMLLHIGATAAAAVTCATTRAKAGWFQGSVAADHVLYDPVLGDRALTRAQWRRLFQHHNLAVEEWDTGLPSYQPTYRPRRRLERNLTHFLLRQ